VGLGDGRRVEGEPVWATAAREGPRLGALRGEKGLGAHGSTKTALPTASAAARALKALLRWFVQKRARERRNLNLPAADCGQALNQSRAAWAPKGFGAARRNCPAARAPRGDARLYVCLLVQQTKR
jgi:hypothetical protein